jgi:outer membrane protein TolC
MQRNKLSKQKGENYDRQGEEVRQQILLQAKEACLDLIFLNQQKNLLDIRRKSAEQLAALYQQRLEQGDANILETNKIELELLNVRNEVRMNEAARVNKQREPIKQMNRRSSQRETKKSSIFHRLCVCE